MAVIAEDGRIGLACCTFHSQTTPRSLVPPLNQYPGRRDGCRIDHHGAVTSPTAVSYTHDSTTPAVRPGWDRSACAATSICARCLFRAPEVRCIRRYVRTHARKPATTVDQTAPRTQGLSQDADCDCQQARPDAGAMLARGECYDADAWQRHPLHPPARRPCMTS